MSESLDLQLLVRLLQDLTTIDNERRQKAEALFNALKSSQMAELIILYLEALSDRNKLELPNSSKLLTCILLVRI